MRHIDWLLVWLQTQWHRVELLLEKLLLEINGRIDLSGSEQLPGVIHLVIEVIVLLPLQALRRLPAPSFPTIVLGALPRLLIGRRYHPLLLLLQLPLLLHYHGLLLKHLLLYRVHPLCEVNLLLHVGRRVVDLLLTGQHHGHQRVVAVELLLTGELLLT